MGRPAGFGLEAESVDGQDVLAVYATAAPLVECARRGDGPAFLLANTYRFRGHHVGDVSRDYYRAKQEEQHWMAERDPVAILGRHLVEHGVAGQAALDEIHAQLTADMDRAVQWAIDAPYPDAEEAAEDVYAAG